MSAVFFLLARPFLPHSLDAFGEQLQAFFPEIEKGENSPVVSWEPDEELIQSPQSVNDSLIAEYKSLPSYDGTAQLSRFYEALKQLEAGNRQKVRIAYFGDSMNDGDWIVQDLRTALQQQFGGKGVGMVNITSESATARASIQHQFGNGWEVLNYMKKDKEKRPYGLSGHLNYPKDANAWTQYQSKIGESALPAEVYLYYGAAEEFDGHLYVMTDKDTMERRLAPLQSLNRLKLLDKAVSQVRIETENLTKVPFYGLSFESETGVYVDNFSLRGNSGLPFLKLDSELMRSFDKMRPYDLIILQYGTNVLTYGSLDYRWYYKKMRAVIAHIRHCFPGADIMLVSVADRGVKYDGEMQTDRAVFPVHHTQKSLAMDLNCGFFDTLEAMGGPGAMKRWVEDEKPALGNQDYTHFTNLGSRRIAQFMNGQLFNGYRQYIEKAPQPTYVETE